MVSVEIKVRLTCTNCGSAAVHEPGADVEIELWHPPQGAIVIVHSGTTLFPKWTKDAASGELLCPYCSPPEDKKEA